jgi:hypothetical protein
LVARASRDGRQLLPPAFQLIEINRLGWAAPNLALSSRIVPLRSAHPEQMRPLGRELQRRPAAVAATFVEATCRKLHPTTVPRLIDGKLPSQETICRQADPEGGGRDLQGGAAGTVFHPFVAPIDRNRLAMGRLFLAISMNNLPGDRPLAWATSSITH